MLQFQQKLGFPRYVNTEALVTQALLNPAFGMYALYLIAVQYIITDVAVSTMKLRLILVVM